MIDISVYILWLEANVVPIGVFVGSIVAFYLFKAIILVRLRQLSEKTDNDIDDFFIDVFKTFRLVFAATVALVVSLYVAGMDAFEQQWVSVLTVAVVTYQVAKTIGVVFTFAVQKTGKGEVEVGSVQGLKTIVNLFVWILGSLTIAALLGYNITSVIAGLGIGGVAVALAVQNILGDIFSSFAIFFDKPFVVGDYIQVGENEGTVEKIGMKSTRIRSLRGEQVVISNKSLTDATVLNFGRLERRRVLMTLGLEYETSNKLLEHIPAAVKQLIEEEKDTEFERVYFKDFGSSALVFELTYYVNSPDFEEFTRLKHSINLKLKAWFEKSKIGMAYPTQTVFVKK